MTNKSDPNYSRELSKVRNWLNLDDPVSIATHINLDADAAFSMALLKALRPEAATIFVRADEIIDDKRTLAVDLSNGKQAVKGLECGSAFGLIVNAMKSIDRPVYNCLKGWAKQLNLTDSGNYCRDNVILADHVSSWKAMELDDDGIVNRAFELIKGKILAEKRYIEMKNVAKQIEINDGIAIVPDDVKVKAAHLFGLGADVVIRQSEFGQSAILSKKALKKGISLSELGPIFSDGWFIHPQGFMLSFGSVKAPKDYRESGFTIDQFTMIIRTWISSHYKSLANSSS